MPSLPSPSLLNLFCHRRIPNRKTNCANCVDCSLIFHSCNGTMFGFVIRIFPRRYMIADESRNKYWHLRISSQHPSPLTPPAALMTNETPFHNNSHWLRPYTSLYIAALCDGVACMSWIHFPHNIRSRSSAIICMGPIKWIVFAVVCARVLTMFRWKTLVDLYTII